MKVNENSAHQIGNFIFAPSSQQLFLNGEAYRKLTHKENQLLEMLAESYILGDVMDRNKALEKIWHEANYFNARSMDVYIVKLRKYLKADTDVEIINLSGKGFKLLIKQK